jgi:hypothetical protein
MTKEDGNIFNAKVLEFNRRDIYVVHNDKLGRVILCICLLFIEIANCMDAK